MIKLTDKNYKNLEKISKYVLKFEASWCGTCRMITPIIEELSANYPEIPIYSVDVEVFKALAEKFNIKGVPDLLFFKDGKVVHQMTGVFPKPSIEHALKVLVSK